MTVFIQRFRYNTKFKKSRALLPIDNITIISWSGMRGLVALALAIALPVAISSHEPFPNRNIIIFLTILTILFTLLTQGLTLPYFIRKLGAGKDDRKEMETTNKIYQHLTKEAIANMNNVIDKELNYSDEAKQLVITYYKNRLSQFNLKYESKTDTQLIGKEAEQLLAKIFKHERDLLFHMRQKGDITDETFIRILQKLDRDEVGFASYR